MLRVPPVSTRIETLFPNTMLFRSGGIPRVDRPEPDPAAHAPDPRGQDATRVHDRSVGALLEGGRGMTPEQHDLHLAAGRLYGRESVRSEEHTSELQSLMRISDAVSCL